MSVRASTIRRMIVFGVCALGVGSLYLMPSLARSPDQIGRQPVSDEPTGSPAGASASQGRQTASTGDDRTAPGPDGERSDASTTPRSAPPTFDTKQRPARDKKATHGSTAYDASDGRDDQAPAPVREMEPPTATRDRLALNWSATTDNVGVVGYKIWLDGFPVASTAETHVELRWFNDDEAQHVVQIRAVDAAGNQSTSSPAFVVTRPTPNSTPTPSPDPSKSPTPDPSASQPNGVATSPAAGEAASVGSESPDETR